MRCLSEFGEEDEEDLLVCAGLGCSLWIHRACVEWTCSTGCASMCTATRNCQDELVIAQQDELNEAGNGASSDRVAVEGGAATEAEECCIRKFSLRQAEQAACLEDLKQRHARAAAYTMQLAKSLDMAAETAQGIAEELDTQRKRRADKVTRKATAARKAAVAALAAQAHTDIVMRQMRLDRAILEWVAQRATECAAPFGAGVHRYDGPMEHVTFLQKRQVPNASYKGLIKACAPKLGHHECLADWALVGYEGEGQSETARLFDSMRRRLKEAVPNYSVIEKPSDINARLLSLIELAMQERCQWHSTHAHS